MDGHRRGDIDHLLEIVGRPRLLGGVEHHRELGPPQARRAHATSASPCAPMSANGSAVDRRRSTYSRSDTNPLSGSDAALRITASSSTMCIAPYGPVRGWTRGMHDDCDRSSRRAAGRPPARTGRSVRPPTARSVDTRRRRVGIKPTHLGPVDGRDLTGSRTRITCSSHSSTIETDRRAGGVRDSSRGRPPGSGHRGRHAGACDAPHGHLAHVAAPRALQSATSTATATATPATTSSS